MPITAQQLANAFPPPVMEARGWADAADLPADMPLLNLSQAAPVDPPPETLRAAMAEIVLNDPGAHLYGPVLGLPELRAAVARRWTEIYAAPLSADQVAITSGCNQAFCAAIAAVADAGDNVILPTPWYFNHKMWLDMAGVGAQLLPCRAGMLPEVAEAEALITDKTRAIILVSPNNPTGAEYSPALISGFAELARSRGLALIIDETYRDFHSQSGPPHDLFAQAWQETVIQLYSFSKVYRLTGHRVGALVTSAARLAQIEKFLDTVTICPNQLGQRAALWGMEHLGDWVAAERAEILSRRAAIEHTLSALPGWEILGCGAYFAYVAHPFDMPSDRLAQRLVAEAGVLLLPGTMFAPTQVQGGDGVAERQLRIAFANADKDGIAVLGRRLAGFAP
ncbi:MAG: aminotransferase [Pseudomonadota bacterium]